MPSPADTPIIDGPRSTPGARRYWPIVYAFIRQTGRSEEVSRDLTQGFLADVVLGRGLLAIASPSRGRFRTLLLRAVSNYLRDDHRRRHAGHRVPPSRRVTLDGPAPEFCDPSLSPETAFASAWVAMLLVDASAQFHAECLRDEREAYWLCLEHRIIRPALEGAPPMSTDELRRITGLGTAPRVAHALASAKRRFAQIVLEVVGTTTDDPRRIHEELGELLSMLEGGR